MIDKKVEASCRGRQISQRLAARIENRVKQASTAWVGRSEWNQPGGTAQLRGGTADICAANSRRPRIRPPGSWFSPPGSLLAITPGALQSHQTGRSTGRTSPAYPARYRSIDHPRRRGLETACDGGHIYQRRAQLRRTRNAAQFAVEYLPRWEAFQKQRPPDRSPVYLDERPRSSIAVENAPLDQPVYRAHVRVMSGFVGSRASMGWCGGNRSDRPRRRNGRDRGPPVVCIVEEVPSGTWPWTALCGTATSRRNQSAPTRPSLDRRGRRGPIPASKYHSARLSLRRSSCSMTHRGVPISPVLAYEFTLRHVKLR